MPEATLNCSIDRCLQGPPIVCGDAQVIEKGQIESIGAFLVAIAAAAADGATQRAADIAAGLPARADRYTPLYTAEDITVPKMAADDSIAAGSQLFFSEDDNVFVSALSKVDNSGVCKMCAIAL